MNRFIQIIYVVTLVTAFILAFACLFPAYIQRQKMRAKVNILQKILDQKKAECLEKNQQKNDIDANAPKAIEKVAREKYKLCKPGEVIYTYELESFKVQQEDSNK